MDSCWFYWFNENLAVSLSLIMNTLVIYFVLMEQTKALQSYRKMILFNCFVELKLAMVTILLRPRALLTSNTFVIVITNHLWKDLSQFQLNLLACLLAIFGATDCIKLLMEFLYRFLLVCRQQEISLPKLILLALAIYLCALANTSLYYLSLSSDPLTEWHDLLQGSEYFNNENRFVVANTHSKSGILLSVLGIITAIFTYSVVVISSQKILITLKEKQAFMSTRTLRMHSGLNKMMFAQACAPIATALLPCCIVFASIFLGYGSHILSNVVSCTLPWTSVAGPLCTLICVPSYRRRVGNLLKGKFHSWNKVSSAHQLSNTLPQRF